MILVSNLVLIERGRDPIAEMRVSRLNLLAKRRIRPVSIELHGMTMIPMNKRIECCNFCSNRRRDISWGSRVCERREGLHAR